MDCENFQGDQSEIELFIEEQCGESNIAKEQLAQLSNEIAKIRAKHIQEDTVIEKVSSKSWYLLVEKFTIAR